MTVTAVVAGQVYRLASSGLLLSTGGRTLQPPNYTGSVVAPGQFTAFTPGTVKPNYAPIDGGTTNIGCRVASANLQQMTVSTYTPPAGSTMQGVELFGELLLPAGAPVTIRDCILHGPNKATYDSGIIRGTSRDLRGALIEWCTLDGTGRESPWTDGVKGGNFTMRYSVITRTNDGLGWSAPVGNGVVETSRIGNGYYTGWYNSTTGAAYLNNPPSPSDMKSHSDGAQLQGRGGWVIRGCYVGGQPSSGWSSGQLISNRDPQVPAQLAFQQLVDSGRDYQDTCILFQNNTGSDAASQLGALVELNWVLGGAAALNLNTNPANSDYLAGVTLRNNRLIRDARGATAGGYKILANSNYQAVITGNVFDDDNTLALINLVEGGTRAQAS